MSLTDAIRLLRTATLEPMQHRSDAELLRRFLDHKDEHAFREIVQRYEGLVRGVCWRRIRVRHAIDDVTQATFLTLARKAASIRRPEALPAWLHQVAKSLAGRVRPSASLIAEPIDSAPSPLDQLSAREMLAIFDEELARLPAHYRTAILLCTLDGLTLDETAQRLQTTEGAIRGWLQRGREQLRKRLQRRGIELAVVMPLLWQATSRSEAGLREEIAQCALGLQPATVAVTKLMGGSSLSPATMISGLVAGMVTTVLLLSTQQKPEEPKQLPAAKATQVELAEADPLPEGAIARIGSPRLRHAGKVTAVAISDDHRWLASASTDSRDKSVRVWDLNTGKEKYRFPMELNPDGVPCSTAIAISPDNKQVLLIDYFSIKAFDLLTGKQKFEKPFSPRQMFQGKRVIFDDQESIIGAQFSPDRKQFAVVRESGEMLLGDITTGEIKTTIAKSFIASPGLRLWGVPILFTPDNSEVCVPIKSDSITIFATTTGQANRTLSISGFVKSKNQEHLQIISGVTQSVALICTGQGESKTCHVVVQENGNGKITRQIPVDAKSVGMAISGDNKLLAVGRFNDTLVYDLASGREVQKIPMGGYPDDLAFSQDSKFIISCYYVGGGIALWDMEKKSFHPQSVQVDFYATFDRQANLQYITAGPNGHVRRTLDWRSEKILSDTEFKNGLGQRVDSPDGKFHTELETKKGDPRWSYNIRIRDKAANQIIASFKEELDYPVQIQFADQNRLLIGVTQDNIVRVWDIASEKLLWMEKYQGQSRFTARGMGGLQFDRQRQRMAFASYDLINGTSFIDVWEIRQKKHLRRIEVPKRLLTAGIAFSPDGTMIAAGNEEVSCWRVSDGQLIHHLSGHIAPANANDYLEIFCRFFPDGRKLLTLDKSGTIRLWELASGKLIRQFYGHRGETVVDLSPDSRYIVGNSPDAPIYIWDVYGTKAKTPFDGESLWKTLADVDAEKAFRAVRELCASPKEALALLKAKLPPDSLDQKTIEQHIADLASPRFAVREKASGALVKISESIEPQLKQALQTTTDEEVRQRLTTILTGIESPSPTKLQALRALDALEHLGTPEAKQYLEILSKSSPPGLRTQLAKEAMERLSEQRSPR